MDKLLKDTNLATVIGTNSWKEQFIEAVTVSGGTVLIIFSSAGEVHSRLKLCLCMLGTGISRDTTVRDNNDFECRYDMYCDSINVVILQILLYDTTILSVVFLRLGSMLSWGSIGPSLFCFLHVAGHGNRT